MPRATMRPMARRLLASLIALALLAGVGSNASAQQAPATPPKVMEAIEAAPAPVKPTDVVVGAFINDIQELDFKTNNYIIDLYVWFRWKNPELRPSKTMEFMNSFTSDDNRRNDLFEKPEALPDGTLYSIIRYQGHFSTKFPLEAYPFDTQTLRVMMEDTISGADSLVYVPDGKHPITLDPVITLPGFTVGKPTMRIITNTYPTNFGDPTVEKTEPYSRIVISIPVTRPVVAMSLKTFVPIVLIVVCASLVFFVRPRYVEGRIGLGITALLTLVALQLTATSGLPDVDYLMMLDKVFLLAYLFIIVALARVVATSWRGADEDAEATIKRHDRAWFGALLAVYLVTNGVILWTSLA